MAPNRLVSVSLNGKGSAGFDPQAETSVKAELKLANLVVEDPEKKLPKSPLAVEVQADGSLRQELLTLRQLIVGLTPTDRARNQIHLAGKVDLAKTNAAPGELTLRAESLDVTPYYDLFAGQPKAAAPEPAKTPQPQPPPPATPSEPDPVTLPFQQFTLDTKIDRLFLRELAVSNLVATTRINGSEVAVKPFQLTVNGAPMDATTALNLGVKGIIYFELEAEGGEWGGPAHAEIHGSFKSIVDSPVWRLVQALASLTRCCTNSLSRSVSAVERLLAPGCLGWLPRAYAATAASAGRHGSPCCREVPSAGADAARSKKTGRLVGGGPMSVGGVHGRRRLRRATAAAGRACRCIRSASRRPRGGPPRIEWSGRQGSGGGAAR